MALTGRVIASIYSYNGYDQPAAGVSGITESFPSALTTFYAAPAGTTANGVAMASIIKLLPTGLNQAPQTFLTDSTPAQLQSGGN